MANKKRLWGILVMSLVLGMTVVGCKSTGPLMYFNAESKEYTILGEVTYKATGKHKGFIDFLAEARKQYPDTDYIIDIMVDLRSDGALMYRGTAIKYKNK